MNKKKYLEILEEYNKMEEAAHIYATEFIALQLSCNKDSIIITDLEFGETSFWFQYIPEGCDSFSSEHKTISIEHFLEWFNTHY